MSITTVFTNGGSQAVRIPREFRFNTSRVTVEACRGGILLRPLADAVSLESVLAQCDALSADEKAFLDERSANGPMQDREMFK